MFLGVGLTRVRAIRRRASRSLRARWTVPAEQPTRWAIASSEGQESALSRAQYRRASRTALAVGLRVGSPAMSWGSAAKGRTALFGFLPGLAWRPSAGGVQ